MLLDYVRLEERQKERIVVENDHWIALVPFWSEPLITSKCTNYD